MILLGNRRIAFHRQEDILVKRSIRVGNVKFILFTLFHRDLTMIDAFLGDLLTRVLNEKRVILMRFVYALASFQS